MNIAIFKRQYPSKEGELEDNSSDDTKNEDSLEDNANTTEPKKDSMEDNANTTEPKKDPMENRENSPELEEISQEDEEDKSLKEKYNEFKPLLNDLKNSKQEIKEFLRSLFKDADFKELDGYLKLGLGDYAKTARIMGWIWSFNAIANTLCEPLHLNGEPTFTEEVIDFDIHAIIKLNLLFVIFHALKLLSHKNVRILIKNAISYFRDDEQDNEIENKSNSNPSPGNG
mgnify:CR=1 FL=1